MPPITREQLEEEFRSCPEARRAGPPDNEYFTKSLYWRYLGHGPDGNLGRHIDRLESRRLTREQLEEEFRTCPEARQYGPPTNYDFTLSLYWRYLRHEEDRNLLHHAGRIDNSEMLGEVTGFSAIHAALLPVGRGGRVLFFAGCDYDNNAAGERNYENTALWDVDSNTVTRHVGDAGHDLFCCGHAFLSDGRLLAAGGTGDGREDPPYRWSGTRKSVLFAPDLSGAGPGRWTATGEMNRYRAQPGVRETGGRWYPTLLTLGDGCVLALGGAPVRDYRDERGNVRRGDDRASNTDVETYDPASGRWSIVGTEPKEVSEALKDFSRSEYWGLPEGVRPPVRGDAWNQNLYAHGWPEQYPRMHLLPDGSVFVVRLTGAMAGGDHSWLLTLAQPELEWSRINPAPQDRSAAEAVSEPTAPAYSNGYFHLGSSVLLPLRPPHYHARVLWVGEPEPSLIDFTPRDPRYVVPPPRWRSTAPRKAPAAQGVHSANPRRRHCNTVLLPDGKVFVVGGTHDECHCFADRNEGGVLLTEAYDSATGEWETWPAIKHVRTYHSTALLLPDGRVWISGSTPAGGVPALKSIEMYSPPYLSRGPRPRVTRAPSAIHYGQAFDVGTPDEVRAVVLCRCGSVTHSFNSDQRLVELLVLRRAQLTSVTVSAPPNGNVAPPGYYMLFALNDDGVPSMGRFVRLS